MNKLNGEWGMRKGECRRRGAKRTPRAQGRRRHRAAARRLPYSFPLPHSPIPILSRRGFTLLEVIIALAILVGALAAIGELADQGLQSARKAALSAVAQLHCESKLAEITAGITAPSAVQSAPLENDAAWLYSIAVDPTTDASLIAVRVTVTENVPPQSSPTEFTLVRWMQDPTTTEAADETSSTGEATP